MTIKEITSKTMPYVVVAVALMAASAATTRLNAIKTEKSLTDTDIVRNAPPAVAFTTVALGCFRGLVADLLWLRTISLQEQGKYFEMVQLADWICKLQPRFTGATVYLAWNMSYNISVTFSDPADRWRWVKNGLNLLLESLAYNPGDPLLYREIAWIYQHKIGDIYDNANLYYKNDFAKDMGRMLGSPNPDWNRLAAAPPTFAALLKSIKDMTAFDAALQAAGARSLDDLFSTFKKDGCLPPAFSASLNNPPLVNAVEDCFRRIWIQNNTGVNPADAAALVARFGVFDWRLPDTFAAYWACKGISASKVRRDENCERVLDYSMRNSFIDGKLLIFDADNFHSFCTIPNLALADSAMNIYRDAYLKDRANSYQSAYIYFMKDAILTLYDYGFYTKALDFMEILRKDFPNDPRFKVQLEEFVLDRWTENAISGSKKQISGMINGYLNKSFFLLAFGDKKASASHEAIARQLYEIYKNVQQAAWDRVGLPNFEQMRFEGLQKSFETLPPPMAARLAAELGVPLPTRIPPKTP